MKPSELLRQRKEEIIALAAKRGAYNVRVFGSIARGTDREDSDIDLLVDLDPNRSLMDLGGLLIDLTEALGRPVDVLTIQGLREKIRTKILEEAKPI